MQDAVAAHFDAACAGAAVAIFRVSIIAGFNTFDDAVAAGGFELASGGAAVATGCIAVVALFACWCLGESITTELKSTDGGATIAGGVVAVVTLLRAFLLCVAALGFELAFVAATVTADRATVVTLLANVEDIVAADF